MLILFISSLTKGRMIMSTGHPGICFHLNNCLIEDGRKGNNNQIVQIHISESIKPESFIASYSYLYRLDKAKISQAIMINLAGINVTAFKGLTFPLYDVYGTKTSETMLDVVFTNHGLNDAMCATIDKSGKIVGK